MKEYEKSKQDFLKVNEFLPDKMKVKPERLDSMYKDYDAKRTKVEKEIPSLKLCKEADQANQGGDIQTALKLYNQVIPKLEIELVKLKDPEEARFIKGNTYYNRAYCYLTSGYYKEALADLNKSIEYSPNFLDSRKNRAKLYELLKRPDLAKPDKDKIVELEAKRKKRLEMLQQKYAKKAEH
jgi:tetratricopeptide (TPR) repeat protein